MSDLIIHHVRVSYDESDERVRTFVKYLGSKKGKEDMERYYAEAVSEKGGKLNVKDDSGNEFTFICNAGHNCILCLRGMEKI